MNKDLELLAADLHAVATHSDAERLAALRDLEAAQERLDQAIADRDEAAARARATGEAWTTIGRITGMSKQGAQQRWGQA